MGLSDRKLRKLDEFVKLVVCSNRTIAEDIAHICLTQNVKLALHDQVVKRTSYCSIDIDKSLAIGDTLVVFLLSYDLIILSPHL